MMRLMLCGWLACAAPFLAAQDSPKDNKVVEGAKTAGKAVGEAGRKVGQAARDGAVAVKEGAKKAGKAVGEGAKKGRGEHQGRGQGGRAQGEGGSFEGLRRNSRFTKGRDITRIGQTD